jgi:glutamate mutase epsilon subunit
VGQGCYFTILGDIRDVDEVQREAELREQMARALLAASSFRAENGDWPRTLEELVPAYMKEVPADPYEKDGEKVKYVVQKEGGAKVYSVGVIGERDPMQGDPLKRKHDMVVGAE